MKFLIAIDVNGIDSDVFFWPVYQILDYLIVLYQKNMLPKRIDSLEIDNDSKGIYYVYPYSKKLYNIDRSDKVFHNYAVEWFSNDF